AEIKEANTLARRQEMERLLYVALTRARRTLVLAFDRALFSPVHDRLAADSQLKYLRGDKGETSCVAFDALADNAEACAETFANEEKNTDALPGLAALTPLDEALLTRARQRAAKFIRKQNPSGYDEPIELPPEAATNKTVARSLADTPATLYGSWWHTLFQHFPWKSDPAQWQNAFEALQPSSPDAKRSAREWPLLAKALRESPLAQFMQRPHAIVHTEYPLLWPINDDSCLEGVIDFLLVDPEARRCLLLDWKTNRLTSREDGKIRARYLSQIAAYWRAITVMTGFEVEAGLFSTTLGKLLLYQTAELEAEWKRLEKLPSDDLRTFIAPDGNLVDIESRDAE
ncbi:MAG: PD-(D/E)XK nuclease family protein, partial [Verrucomicrobiota bacterium]|nr:PD-(D/E)XK nuclease family protein [Verrucomicrobiota bacterium]